MANLIFGIIMLLMLVLITAVSLSGAAGSAGNVLGVAVPLSEHGSPEVQAEVRAFRRQVLRIAGLFLLLGVPVLLAGRWVWLQFPLLLIWDLAHLGAVWRCQEHYAERMRALRKEKGWPVPDPNRFTVDTGLNRKRMGVSPLWMLPGTILALAAAIGSLAAGGASMLPAALAAVLLQGVCWLIRFACRKGRATAYSEDPDVNRACHSAAIRGWTGYAALFSLLSALMALFLWLNGAGWLSGEIWSVLPFLLMLAGVLGGSLFTIQRIRKSQRRILGQTEETIPVEDDLSSYKWGFYNNPRDPRVVVPKRLGTGFTFNVGRPAGKWLMGGTLGFAVLMLAGIFGSLIWMGAADYTITIGADSVSVSAPFYGQEFPLSELEGVSLAESIPDGSRTNGAAFGSTLLGHFRLDGVGNAVLYVDTRRMPCLVLDFGDVTVYYTAETPEETARLAEELTALLP